MARYPPLSTGLACPAEAARITLLRNATAAGLLQAICTCLYVSASVYMWSQNVRRLAYSFLPHRLWPAGRGLRGQSDLRYSAATVSIIPLGSCSGGGLAGRTFSGGMLPTVPGCLTFAEEKAWKEVAR